MLEAGYSTIQHPQDSIPQLRIVYGWLVILDHSVFCAAA